MLDELEQLEKSFLSMSMEGDEFDSDMSFDQEIPDIDMEVDPVIPRVIPFFGFVHEQIKIKLISLKSIEHINGNRDGLYHTSQYDILVHL